MTTATRTRPKKTDVLAGLAEREQAVTDATAKAHKLAVEFKAKYDQANALATQRQALTHRDPALVDHHGNPVDPDNPVGLVDRQICELGDLADLRLRMDHGRTLKLSARQSVTDYAAAHLPAILAALEPEAQTLVDEVVAAMAALHEAGEKYLGLAFRVAQLNSSDERRRHLRVPAVDVGSDLRHLTRDYEPPPSPTEIR